jgi:hypothetical protein
MDTVNSTSSSVKSTIDAPAHDEPYRFGRRPTVRAPFPFTEREFARLLIARGRTEAAAASDDLPFAAAA